MTVFGALGLSSYGSSELHVLIEVNRRAALFFLSRVRLRLQCECARASVPQMQPDTDLEGSHLKRPFAQQRGGAILKSRIRVERHTHIIKPKDKQIQQSHLHICPSTTDEQSWAHANIL